MEHILQFGISIDDDKIEKAVIEAATREAKNELKRKMFADVGWDAKLSYTAERIVKESIAGWKDEIIELAAAQVAETIKRSKAYREKVKEITE